MTTSVPELFRLPNRQRCIGILKQLKTFHPSNVEVKFQSAVLIPLVCYDCDKPAILYTRRSLYVRNFPGEVSFPGGKIDEGESIVEAALRELNEEVGIPSCFVDIWTTFAPCPTRNALSLIYPVIGFIGNYDSSKEILHSPSGNIHLKPSPGEVDMIIFRSIDWLSDPAVRRYCIHRFPPSLPFTGTRVSFFDNSQQNQIKQMYQTVVLPVFSCVDSPRITGATAFLTYQVLTCLLPQGLPGKQKTVVYPKK
ncbi:hypothetical protein Aperf_G00000085782 [Anoplocephala perfoliata]